MTKKNVKSTFSKEDLKRINDLIKEVEENIVKYKEEMTKEKDFCDAIKESILYWDDIDRSSKDKMSGLAFSILCMLDGMSGSFDGSIEDLRVDEGGIIMLHELFYEDERKKANDE